MLRGGLFSNTATRRARAYGEAWLAGGTLNSTFGTVAKKRDGAVEYNAVPEVPLRRALCSFTADDYDTARPTKKLVDLPGVETARDLPADPITRLFFQTKGDQALFQGTYEAPRAKDSDRVQIARRDVPFGYVKKLVRSPVYDFCHRLREGSEQRKRFVIVQSTIETRGCAEILHRHGLIAGFRDFHNDRAFAVELKYFQNEPSLETIEPSVVDARCHFEWSPKMMRRLMNMHGIHNRITIFICRTHDGRIIDHIEAAQTHVGGRGLLMAR
jgi:ribosomal protein S8